MGGVFTEWLSWRWLLLINLPIGIALYSAAAYSVKESKAVADNKLDIPGALSITAGLMALVYGIAEGSPVVVRRGVRLAQAHAAG